MNNKITEVDVMSEEFTVPENIVQLADACYEQMQAEIPPEGLK